MKYVAYYRVSASEQSDDSLLLDSQKALVRATVEHVGGGEILAEFNDADQSDNRSGLRRAIAHARKLSAIVVVSRLDRLSGNVSVLSSLLSTSDVVFLSSETVDGRLVVQFFASVRDGEDEQMFPATSQQKRSKFSQRLQSVFKLLRFSSKQGSPQNLTPAAQQKGVQVVKQKAIDNEANKRSTAIALQLRKDGKNLTEIAFELNKSGLTTARGKQFQPVQVQRLLQRADKQHHENTSQKGLFD